MPLACVIKVLILYGSTQFVRLVIIHLKCNHFEHFVIILVGTSLFRSVFSEIALTSLWIAYYWLNLYFEFDEKCGMFFGEMSFVLLNLFRTFRLILILFILVLKNRNKWQRQYENLSSFTDEQRLMFIVHDKSPKINWFTWMVQLPWQKL